MSEQNPKDSKKPSGPVETKDWMIEVDRELCIGAATCIALAPGSFALDSESKAIILESIDKEQKETILEAAKSCPTAAIIIKDKKGNKIFPE